MVLFRRSIPTAALCGALAFAGLSVTPDAAAQGEVAMTPEEAPADALAAAQAAAPNVTFESVSIEVEDGVSMYAFVGSRGDGQTVEVDVARWAVLEIEEAIAASNVPDEVMDMVELEIPGFSPTSIELSDHGLGRRVYAFEGVNADGEEVDVEIQANGENVVVMGDDEA